VAAVPPVVVAAQHVPHSHASISKKSVVHAASVYALIVAVAVMWRRKLKLKAKFESCSSHYGFKR
jgi:hypothetical protein